MKSSQKLFLAVAFFANCLPTVNLFSQGIQFIEAVTDSDIAVINKRADEEKKLIFIDCYTEWCGPCKWMSREIFTNDTVAKFYNENFICVKMDMEKGVGISRTYKYNVHSYPSFVFIGQSGIVHRAAGAMDAQAFIEVGKTALNPEIRLEKWTNQYKTGKREPAFIREYLKQMYKAGMETKEVADWYFGTVKDEELLTKEHFEMIEMFVEEYYVNAPQNTVFDFLLANKEKYVALVGKEKVEEKIYSTFQNSPYWNDERDSVTGQFITKIDLSAMEKLMTKIKENDFAKKDELLSLMYCTYYYQKKEKKKYVEQCVKFIDNYASNDFNTLNSFAWSFYEDSIITDKASLEIALKWAKKSVELNDNCYNNDTYAALLYKLGRKKEAMQAAEKAIALGKKDNTDVSVTEKLLEKIKKMK